MPGAEGNSVESPLFLMNEAEGTEPGFWAETRFLDLETRSSGLHLLEPFRAFEFALQVMDAGAETFRRFSPWDIRGALEREVRRENRAWALFGVTANTYARESFRTRAGGTVEITCHWLIVEAYWAILFFTEARGTARLMVACPHGPDLDPDDLRVAQMNARDLPEPPRRRIERFIWANGQ